MEFVFGSAGNLYAANLHSRPKNVPIQKDQGGNGKVLRHRTHSTFAICWVLCCHCLQLFCFGTPGTTSILQNGTQNSDGEAPCCEGKKPQHSTNIRTLGQNLVAVLGLDMNKNLNCKCPQTFCYSKRRNCWDPLLRKITNANNSYLNHYLLSGFPSKNFRKTLGLLKSILRAIAEDMAHTAQLLACLLLAMTKHGI